MKEWFDNILQFTLGYEKFKSNDPRDPGGLTIWGIASKYHPVAVSRMDKMSKEEAKKVASEIYWNEYWSAGNCDKLPEKTSQAHFDCCVNPGIGAAVRFIQKVVGVAEDGSFGPKTKKAVDNYLLSNSDESFANKIIELRRDYYVAKNNATFGRGWANRVNDLKKFLKLC